MPESCNLAICEIFNPEIHGLSELSSKNITTQFLVHTKILPKELMKNMKKIEPMMQQAGKMLEGLDTSKLGGMLNSLEGGLKQLRGGNFK